MLDGRHHNEYRISYNQASNYFVLWLNEADGFSRPPVAVIGEANFFELLSSALRAFGRQVRGEERQVGRTVEETPPL